MYQSFGISLTSQSLSVRNSKILQLQLTSLRIFNQLNYSTQYAARNRQYLPQPENVFIERGDRFKLLHNTKEWVGINRLGPLIDIENINEIIKKQTASQMKNSRKMKDIKETKINELHIPKYVRIKLRANKQFKPLKLKKNWKRVPRTKPENELRLQRKQVDEFVGEYYWPEKFYDINLNENLQDIRKEFRKNFRKSKSLTIAKILHPQKKLSMIVSKQNTKLIINDVLLPIDRNSQNNILNKIFYNTNDEQLKTNKYIDHFKRPPIVFTNKEIILNKPRIKLYSTLDNSTLTQSAVQKIRAMINPYSTNSVQRLRIFNNNHYRYIYEKHLFNDIEDGLSKPTYIINKRPEKRLQILDFNTLKKERILQYIKNHNYLNMPTKSIHIQVNLPLIRDNTAMIRVCHNMSNEWSWKNVLNRFKLVVSKILVKNQPFLDTLITKHRKYIDRIRYYLGLRRSKYIDSLPKLTNSDLSILKHKQKLNKKTSVCHLDNVHPTCIVNSRNDYFTEPSLDELVPYVDPSNQTCIVDNFTIERIDYGKIEFLEPVDVYNLNIDKYVQFTRNNIDVYPNDVDKPPIGFGLNKKSKVTLYEVWPIDKYTNAIITDESHLESLRFKSMLEAICAERNFKFLSYCDRTGCWVFCVDHF